MIGTLKRPFLDSASAACASATMRGRRSSSSTVCSIRSRFMADCVRSYNAKALACRLFVLSIRCWAVAIAFARKRRCGAYRWQRMSRLTVATWATLRAT